MIVTQGYGKGIGGIGEVVGKGNTKLVLKHGGYLFFGGVAFAGYSLFYGAGLVLGNGCACYHSGGNGYALCAPEFEHTLYVFSVERFFDGYTEGLPAFGEFKYALEDGF